MRLSREAANSRLTLQLMGEVSAARATFHAEIAKLSADFHEIVKPVLIDQSTTSDQKKGLIAGFVKVG